MQLKGEARPIAGFNTQLADNWGQVCYHRLLLLIINILNPIIEGGLFIVEGTGTDYIQHGAMHAIP